MDYYKNRIFFISILLKLIWAANVPVTDDVGVLFGGTIHFYSDINKLKGSLQVFLKDRFPDRPLFIINKCYILLFYIIYIMRHLFFFINKSLD